MRNTRSRQRLELLQQIQALREQGESILGIAQRLDWSRSTVYR
jgi:DNA-binding transcriptional MerR regulator